MRLIAKKALVNFWEIHPEAEKSLQSWFKAIRKCNASDFPSLHLTFGSADYVPDKYTIFDVGGNKYRIVTVIHYDTQIVYIRHVFTHAEYNKWTKGKNETSFGSNRAA